MGVDAQGMEGILVWVQVWKEAMESSWKMRCLIDELNVCDDILMGRARI